MINEKNISKLRHILKKEPKPRAIKSQDLKFNRKMLELGGFEILVSPESLATPSRIKKVDSGLNHVLAKIASKNKIAMGINLQDIRSKDLKKKAIKLEKLRQNIHLANKHKFGLALLNSKDQLDSRALLTSLGASSQQTKSVIFI
jgi:RNase P/RNase MRP subunit p30